MNLREGSGILLFSFILLLLFAGCDGTQELFNSSATSNGGLSPQAFKLLYPSNGENNVGLTPTLRWESSVDPEGGSILYTVRLRTGGGGAKVTTVSQNFYTLTTPLSPSTTYYWQVDAQDPAGNTKKTPYYVFTTGTGGGGGGGGGGGFSINTLSGFTQTGVRKGVILHNPYFSMYPNYLVYVYIDSSLTAFSRESFDGGSTWGAAIPIAGTSNARDLAIALDGNGKTIALIINNTGDDSCLIADVMYSTRTYGGTWATPMTIRSIPYPDKGRLPSAVHTTGNEYLFAFGYEITEVGGAGPDEPDDTWAKSMHWDGNTMIPSSENNIGLPLYVVDAPVVCQQIAFDPSENKMYYLYFDNHFNYENQGGDMIAIQGSYPTTWYGAGSEVRVVNAGNYERPGQGYLFRGNGGDYILVYALEVGPVASPTGNTLYLKHAPTLAALETASTTTLENALQYAVDTWSRYRTVYAAQDNSGDVHLVYQDQGNTIKWAKINSSTYTVEHSAIIATGQWLDSISLGQNKLYVSTISSTYSGNSASIIEVSF